MNDYQVAIKMEDLIPAEVVGKSNGAIRKDENEGDCGENQEEKEVDHVEEKRLVSRG